MSLPTSSSSYDKLKAEERINQDTILFRLYTKLESIAKKYNYTGKIEIDDSMYELEVDFKCNPYDSRGRLLLSNPPFKIFKTITYQSNHYDHEYGGNPWYIERIRELSLDAFRSDYDFGLSGFEFSNLINKVLEEIEKGFIDQQIKNRINLKEGKQRDIIKYELRNLNDILKRLDDPVDYTLFTCKFCKREFYKEDFDTQTKSCLSEECSPANRHRPTLEYNNTYLEGKD